MPPTKHLKVTTPTRRSSLLARVLVQALQDKDGRYSLREVTTLVLLVLTVIQALAHQLANLPVPEFMFISTISGAVGGGLSYAFERRSSESPSTPTS